MKTKIDKKRFFPIVIIIAVVLVLVSVSLQQVQATVDRSYALTADKFDWLFIASNICAFVFSLWVAFGPYGKIKLGGEDAKILFLSNGLEVRMNGTCAGGTGAFIDQMATLLNVPLEEMDDLAKQYEKTYTIASRCGVFAKTDIQPLLKHGELQGQLHAAFSVNVRGHVLIRFNKQAVRLEV